MTVQEINTPNWQISLAQPATVVTGMGDIQQCIDVILKTRKGSDPLRPHFGCGLFDYIDKPINIAIPNMKKAILEALKSYEPRVQVVSITSEILSDGKL